MASTIESNQVPSSTKLGEEAKQKLLELQAQLQKNTGNNSPENSNYIKFKPGYDCKVLKFEPERTHTEYVQYDKTQEPAFQYKFHASELIDKKENKWTRVREWTVAPTWAKLVVSLLLKGFLTQEVTRTGSGINDTSYSVTPFVE